MGSAVEGDSFIFAHKTNSIGLRSDIQGDMALRKKGKRRGKGQSNERQISTNFDKILYISCTTFPKIALKYGGGDDFSETDWI